MLVRSTVMFAGCQVWLEAETAREAKRAAARFNRWFIDHIGETALFLGDKSATAAKSTKTSPQRRSTRSVQSDSNVVEG